MQKTAQKRGLINKLVEWADVPGKAAEKLFDPEFKRVMESLRQKDDNIRSIVSGEAIGNGEPGPDLVSLKELLKSSKSNLNRREYMTAISLLGRFHKKVADVIIELNNLDVDVDKVHHEFLFKELGDEPLKHLRELHKRIAHEQKALLIKEAGIMDFFYNLGKRGRALAAWEKRYPKQTNKLKKDSAILQSRSEHMLTQILSALKEMATARSLRNIDNYVKAAEKIKKGYESYNKLFVEFYKDNVKGFLDKYLVPAEKVEEVATPMVEQEIKPLETANTVLAPAALIPQPSVKPPAGVPAGISPPFPPIPKKPEITTKDLPSFVEPEDDEEKTEIDKNIPVHAKFFASLQSLSNEDPLVLASYISKYAKSIKNTDPQTAIQLFKIVKNIRG